MGGTPKHNRDEELCPGAEELRNAKYEDLNSNLRNRFKHLRSPGTTGYRRRVDKRIDM